MTGTSDQNLWFLQPPGAAKPNHQQAQHSPTPQNPYQSPNPTNPFSNVTQSPLPQDGSAYPTPQSLQQVPPYSPPQQGSPYPQQQPPSYPHQAYTQSSPYSPPQQGYQGPPLTHPQQGYGPFKSSNPNSQSVGEASSFYGLGPPPVAQPGHDDRGFFDSVMQTTGVQQPPPGPDGLEKGWFPSSKNPLDPPPPMFKRPPPGHYAYIMFRPVNVLAVSDRLQDGFVLMPPVSNPGDPHPFISHDITEEDWHKFLKDFQKTAHLSASDRLFQGITNNFMKDKIQSPIVQRRVAENKLELISDYLFVWNHYFFHPRRMSVVLAKGSHRFTGEFDNYPPDINGHAKKTYKEKKGSHKTRSANVSSVTAAEPYPKGSLVGNVLNPLHKTIHDTTMAVATAPNQILLGTQSSSRSIKKSKGKKYSGSESESDSSSSSSSSSESDFKYGGRAAGRALRESRRQEKRALREARRHQKKALREAHRAQKLASGEAYGKKEKKKHREESRVDVPSDRFRLVLCYWDGHQEVF